MQQGRVTDSLFLRAGPNAFFSCMGGDLSAKETGKQPPRGYHASVSSLAIFEFGGLNQKCWIVTLGDGGSATDSSFFFIGRIAAYFELSSHTACTESFSTILDIRQICILIMTQSFNFISREWSNIETLISGDKLSSTLECSAKSNIRTFNATRFKQWGKTLLLPIIIIR